MLCGQHSNQVHIGRREQGNWGLGPCSCAGCKPSETQCVMCKIVRRTAMAVMHAVDRQETTRSVQVFMQDTVVMLSSHCLCSGFRCVALAISRAAAPTSVPYFAHQCPTGSCCISCIGDCCWNLSIWFACLWQVHIHTHTHTHTHTHEHTHTYQEMVGVCRQGRGSWKLRNATFPPTFQHHLAIVEMNGPFCCTLHIVLGLTLGEPGTVIRATGATLLHQFATELHQFVLLLPMCCQTRQAMH